MKLLLFVVMWYFYGTTTSAKTMINNRGRIIGGQTASAGQFPFIASFYADTPTSRIFCSGSLIDVRFVLTAAQCVYGATQFTISFGSVTLDGNDPNRVTVTATQYFVFEEPGNSYDPNVLWHDIGIIKLNSAIATNQYIQVIGYAPMGYLYPGAKLTTMGWGQVSDASTSDSNVLQYVDVEIIDQFECQNYYGAQLCNDMICAVGSPNQGICHGDVGAPLVAVHIVFGNLTSAGVGSFVSGNGCESSDPKGYTRADAYTGFIDDTLKNN